MSTLELALAISGAVLTVIGTVATVLATAYARHAHRLSVKAPILKIVFCDPNGGPIDFPPRSVDPVPMKLEVPDKDRKPGGAARLAFAFSVVVRNVGTMTARSPRLYFRYSTLFAVLPSASGQLRQDPDRSKWIVVEHELPDLHPGQSHKLESDLLSPDEKWLRGVVFPGKAKAKDGRTIKFEMKVEMQARVEVVLYSEDVEPIFRECLFELERSAHGAKPSPVT